jgi:hypothetical protein
MHRCMPFEGYNPMANEQQGSRSPYHAWRRTLLDGPDDYHSALAAQRTTKRYPQSFPVGHLPVAPGWPVPEELRIAKDKWAIAASA